MLESDSSGLRFRLLNFVERLELRLYTRAMFVEERRIEKELGMIGTEDAAVFRDASLSQYERLPAGRERARQIAAHSLKAIDSISVRPSAGGSSVSARPPAAAFLREGSRRRRS